MCFEIIALLSDDLQSIVWRIYVQELRTRRFHRFLSDSVACDTCDIFNIDDGVCPTLVTLWDARCWIFRHKFYGLSSYITYRGALGHSSHEFGLHWGFFDDNTHWVREDYRRHAADQAHPVFLMR